MQLSAQFLRLARLVHGDRDELRAGRAKRFVMVPVIRQLAETERSPVTAIEEDDEAAGSGGEFRQAHSLTR